MPLLGDKEFIISMPYGVTELRHGPGIGVLVGSIRLPSTHAAMSSMGRLTGIDLNTESK
jgi:hypothetical protein